MAVLEKKLWRRHTNLSSSKPPRHGSVVMVNRPQSFSLITKFGKPSVTINVGVEGLQMGGGITSDFEL